MNKYIIITFTVLRLQYISINVSITKVNLVVLRVGYIHSNSNNSVPLLTLVYITVLRLCMY